VDGVIADDASVPADRDEVIPCDDRAFGLPQRHQDLHHPRLERFAAFAALELPRCRRHLQGADPERRNPGEMDGISRRQGFPLSQCPVLGQTFPNTQNIRVSSGIHQDAIVSAWARRRDASSIPWGMVGAGHRRRVEKEHSMNRFITLALAAGALAAGFATDASALKFKPMHLPHAAPMAQRAAAKALAGTWLAVYDGGTHNCFVQWHKDGTSVQNADFPSVEGNVIMGDWAAVDKHTASVNLTAWSYDDSGGLTGLLVKTETVTLGLHDTSYSGDFEVTFYDLEGNIVFQHSGTLTATRVSVE
jgi:hypothetical protein